MKKKSIHKLPIIITIVVLISIIFIIVMTIVRKSDCYYYMIKPNHYYLNTKNPTFDIDVFSNHLDDYYLHYQTIDQAIIREKNKEDFYTIKINQIISENVSIKYNNKDYYKYRLNITIPIKNIDSFQIDQAILELNYISNENIRLDIGSIIVYEELNHHHIDITCMKGVVNSMQDLQVLSGIGLTISSIYNMVINNILPLDRRILIKSSSIKRLKDETYDNSLDISRLLDEEYLPLVCDLNFKKIELNKNIKYHYLMPLSYKELFSINTLGFIIHYMIDGISYQQLIYPFQFYSSTQLNYRTIKYEPNSYNQFN